MKKEKHSAGYVYVIDHDSPMADSRGRVLEHRYLMAEKLGRALEPNEVVHHKDEDKRHNDDSNLELTTRGEHTKKHHPARMIKRKCPQCGEEVVKPARRAFGRRVFCSKSCSTKFYAPGKSKQRTCGTVSGYRGGCRCGACRAAKAEAMRKYRSEE